MSKKIFITCALPYINADPHLGHVFEFIQGDCFARFNQLIGHEVYFTAGTDENSLKNILAAKAKGVDLKSWIDEKSNNFLKLSKDLNIGFDDFIKTTEKRHHLGAKKFWGLMNKKDFEKRNYQGLYCVGCESFYQEEELVDGLCPEHKTKPELVTEQNYFFKLGNYKKALLEKIQSNEWHLLPEKRKNEVLGFLKGDVFDLSVTRPKKRSEGLGIEIPDDENQVLWVWIDALSNYINVLNFGKEDDALFKKWWNESDERWHFLGKGILRFHAVFWPAFLMSAGLKLPTNLFCHGYVNLNNQKMSKSLGNVIDPNDLIKKYPLDSLRYYLMKEIPSGDDGNFEEQNLVQRHNSELCSSFGNLISRVFSLAEKYQKPITLSSFSKQLVVAKIVEDYTNNFKVVKINDALANAFEVVALTNKYISDEKPWSCLETDDAKFEQIISDCLWGIIYATMLLKPIMPETCQKVFKLLKLDLKTLEAIPLTKGQSFSLKKSANLFEKI